MDSTRQVNGLRRTIQAVALGFLAAVHLAVLVLVIMGSIND
jgi:hypothetical protein